MQHGICDQKGGEEAIIKRQDQQTGKKQTGALWRRFAAAALICLIALLAAVSATYAWYVYQTGRHTTTAHLAAGAGTNLQISNEANGVFSSATMLQQYTGQLVPVSTNSILGGFQRVTEFEDNTTGSGASLVASVFDKSLEQDCYKAELFLRTSGGDTDIYISDIGFVDNEPENPISSAMRVGFVVHGQTSEKEYIFELSDAKNPQAEYNTKNGQQGHVLDSSKTDGTTVEFDPYTKKNYCEYSSADNTVTTTDDSLMLCTVPGTDKPGEAGEAVQIDVYLWLEGCDEDCVGNLAGKTLSDVSISFAGKPHAG